MLGFAAVVLHLVLAQKEAALLESAFHRKVERILSILSGICSVALVSMSISYVNSEAIGGYQSFIADMRPANLYFGSWIMVFVSSELLIISYLEGKYRLWIQLLISNLVVVWSSGKLLSICHQDNWLFLQQDNPLIPDSDGDLQDESLICNHILASLILGGTNCIIVLFAWILSAFSKRCSKKLLGVVSIMLLLISGFQVGVSSFGSGPATLNYQVFDDDATVYVTNLYFSGWLALFLAIILPENLMIQCTPEDTNSMSVNQWSSWVLVSLFSTIVLSLYIRDLKNDRNKNESDLLAIPVSI